MARSDWFNENSQRSFPFLSGTVENPESDADSVQRMPRSLIVDASILVGINVDFDQREHRIWLHSITRDGPELTLILRNGALDPEETDVAHLEVVVTAADEIQLVHETWPFVTYDLACSEDVAWEAFLTFGAFTEDSLDAWITDGATLTGDETTQIEPALIKTFFQAYTRSLNLANSRRTHAQSDDGCDPIEWPEDAERPEDWPVDGLGMAPTTVVADCIAGKVRFEEGYNCAIEINASAGSIQVGARPGSGAGEVQCTGVLGYPDEEPPPGRTTLDGGFRCEEVFRSVNGVGGPNVPIIGGAGVTVSSEEDDNKVVVSLDGRALQTCYPAEEPTSEAECNSIAATTAGDPPAPGTECFGRMTWLYTQESGVWTMRPDYAGYSTGCQGDCDDCRAPIPQWTPTGDVLDVTDCICHSDACDSSNAPFWYWNPDGSVWTKIEGSGTCPYGCVAYPPELIVLPAPIYTVQGICAH